MGNENPEKGLRISANGIDTNYHDQGPHKGTPVLLIHGSGPGVTAWANWRFSIPELSQERRVLAPDIVGFGYTDRPAGIVYDLDTWLRHVVDFLGSLDLEQIDIVGNSFGGALAIALAIRHPEKVRKLVLMGAVGVNFELTHGLDAVWGYTPSLDNMRDVLNSFAYDHSLISEELVALRYNASIRPGYQEAFEQMFPAPRQRWVDALASQESAISNLDNQTLIIHGREDNIIPSNTSTTLFRLIERSQLHLFGQCGHWVQIEHAKRFNRLVNDFLNE